MIDERGTMHVGGSRGWLEGAGRWAKRGASLGNLARTVVFASCLTLLLCSSSLAAVTHKREATFTGSEVPGGTFGFVWAGTTDNSAGPSSGDIYVGSYSTVYKLNPDGTYAGIEITGAEAPQGAFGLVSETESLHAGGIAVDSSSSANSGDLYLADVEHGVVDKFSETGKFICQISGRPKEEASSAECAGPSGSPTPAGSIEPTGVTVEKATGDVLVADYAHSVIDRFDPAGKYTGQIVDPHISKPGAIALDAAGNLYVTAIGRSVIVLHEGAFTRTLDEHEPSTVAVDPNTGNVYVPELEELTYAEYDSSGNLVDRFSQGFLVFGLAVSNDGHVYAEEPFSSAVSKFSPDLAVPDAVTDPATGVTETGATLNGHVDPDTAHGGGPVTACGFEYVTREAFEASGFEGAAQAACEPATPYAGPQEVTAAVNLLAPSTHYKFRLRASNANEIASFGAAEEMATTGPPVVGEEKASTLTASGVTLSATIDASGFEADCQVQYVDEAAYERAGFAEATTLPCTPATLPAGGTEEKVSVTISGLALTTTYHYRFVSHNAAGATQGADQTFATFGIKSFSFEVLDKESRPYTQAGGHPYEWTTSFTLNSTPTEISGHAHEAADANVRDVEAELPAGLLASAKTTPRCARDLVALGQCSSASQVGEIEVLDANDETFIEGVYNVVPPSGVPVEFGAVVANLVRVYIDGNVRTGGDYGATAKLLNASEEDNIKASRFVIWGVPEDPSHNSSRICTSGGQRIEPCPGTGPLVPTLTNPTSCPGSALTATLRVDSWQAPGQFVSATSEIPATTGCGVLNFTPSITIAPDSTVADSPAGLTVNLEVPQNETPFGLETSALKNTTVQLPVGMAISASAANGLEACSEAEIGLHSSEPATCPNGSKIGTVEITSPLLADHLTGGVYVARQNENPFHSLLAMYIEAEADGARVKLAGHVVADPVTGQLTTTFEETPQVPFSDFQLILFGGKRGALATPEACGPFASAVSLAPWDGLAAANLAPTFSISSGCVIGFKPTLAAGTVSTQAGAYSPFTLSLARSDSDEEISGLTVKLPPGLLAKITGVPQCTDTQAAADACPAASQIGTVEATAGPGPAPLSLPGRMYLTGPYKGAPYGEEVVVPAVAGPYNLGDVVVRGTIKIDPVTAQASVVSDPFPAFVQNSGIPTRVRRVDVTVNRPNFVFNPTSCNPLSLTGTATSVGGVNVSLLSRFQVGGCGELPLKPSFRAAAGGPGSRLNGASLDVKIAAKRQGPQLNAARSEANIRKVEVQLPKALPSRLPTLQKACTEAQFAKSPAGCPAASIVGHAVAHTPVLPDPLQGPAYLVSHGGAQFPDLVLVLSGDNVTIDVTGHTQIKHGITYSRFETVPDAPISTFELQLPAGPKSLLGAFGNLCSAKVAKTLVMPTTITAQSGAVLKQSTKLGVTGCKRHVTRAGVRKAQRTRRADRKVVSKRS